MLFQVRTIDQSINATHARMRDKYTHQQRFHGRVRVYQLHTQRHSVNVYSTQMYNKLDQLILWKAQGQSIMIQLKQIVDLVKSEFRCRTLSITYIMMQQSVVQNIMILKSAKR